VTLAIDRDTYFKPKFCKPGFGYTTRHAGQPQPSRIVIHTTNGRVGSSFDAECTFLAESKSVSAHYLVGKQLGQLVRFLVPQIHVAWHTGSAISGFGNVETIGIECHLTPGEPWTRPMRDQLTQLVLDLCVIYPIGDVRTETRTHREIALPPGRKIDPSGWDDLDFEAWREMVQCRRMHAGVVS
jgi:N-acetyl-anhydromuramyl-L-alanine amidase AmpD